MNDMTEEMMNAIKVTATEYADYHIVKDAYNAANANWVVTPTQDFSTLEENRRYTAYDCAITNEAGISTKIEIKSREKYHIYSFHDIQVNQEKIDNLIKNGENPILIAIYVADGKMAVWDVNSTNYATSTQYSKATTIASGSKQMKQKQMYSFPIAEATVIDFDRSEWYRRYYKCYYFHYYNVMNAL